MAYPVAYSLHIGDASMARQYTTLQNQSKTILGYNLYYTNNNYPFLGFPSWLDSLLHCRINENCHVIPITLHITIISFFSFFMGGGGGGGVRLWLSSLLYRVLTPPMCLTIA